ncbi:MAG: aldehyde dehydrogenase [Tardiphaga sp.]|jgi:thiamine pyrophosphate-dependent acetolactate synthase large subunit-like protein|nr:aldehyde dehydrogenase [Tardiphaga sp.]
MAVTFGTMDRRAAVKALLADRRDLLVVTGLGSPTYDVFAAGEHDGNFYLWGAMGGAVMVGLGLALAQPKRPVLVVTGDGEALMGIGSLLTVAVKQPKNLTIAVLDNGHYGETGMQLSHAGLGARLDIIAQGAGFQSISLITDLNGVAGFRTTLHDIGSGPHFAQFKIQPGNTERALPPRDGAFVKNRLRQHLGFAVT